MHGITLSEGFKQERNSIILFLKKLILRRSTRRPGKICPGATEVGWRDVEEVLADGMG